MTFSGTAKLTSTTNRQVWARPPIDVDFQVLMFTSSGLIVRFLKVFEKSNYHSVKWVRYLTKASGSYQIRVRLSIVSRHKNYVLTQSSSEESVCIVRRTVDGGDASLYALIYGCFVYGIVNVIVRAYLRVVFRTCHSAYPFDTPRS